VTPELERLLPQDLQELVRRFGGYHKIPAEAWVKYDRALEMTHEWLAANNHRQIKKT
jgi:hypothetical protein